MLKIKELLGLPVIDLSTGKEIGEVKDVVIDAENYRMVGVLLCHAGWFRSGKGIMREQLKSMGPDSLTVESEAAIVQEEVLVLNGRTLSKEDILGKHIVTTEGKTVGMLADIYVDAATGALTGYEISDSVITDLLEGRKQMPLPAIQKIGEETVIVSDEQELNNQPVEENEIENRIG